MKRGLLAWGLVLALTFALPLVSGARDCCKRPSGLQVLTLYAGSEQILQVGFKPLQVVAANPAVVRGGIVFPLSSGRIFLKALAPGQTKVLVWGKKNHRRELVVRVLARDLREQLKKISRRLASIKSVCCCIDDGRILVYGYVELPQQLAKVYEVAAGYPQVEVRVQLKPGYLKLLARKVAQALNPWQVRVYPASSEPALIVEGEVFCPEDYRKVLWIAKQYYPTIIDRLVVITPYNLPFRMAGSFVP